MGQDIKRRCGKCIFKAPICIIENHEGLHPLVFAMLYVAYIF
jgi:hypothetical protein